MSILSRSPPFLSLSEPFVPRSPVASARPLRGFSRVDLVGLRRSACTPASKELPRTLFSTLFSSGDLLQGRPSIFYTNSPLWEVLLPSFPPIPLKVVVVISLYLESVDGGAFGVFYFVRGNPEPKGSFLQIFLFQLFKKVLS